MNNKLTQTQKLQEENYSFPYHHLTQPINGKFKQSHTLNWGYEYQSYIEFVISLLKKTGFTSLLDVGCGDGKFTLEVSRKFPKVKIVGTDYSRKALLFARAFNPDGIYIEGDIKNKDLFSEQFDIVTLIETLEHIKQNEVEDFISGIANVVKSGGKLIITVPSTTRPVNSKHYQHFTKDSLMEYLKPHFTIVDHYFLNKVGIFDYIIKRIMSNRFFLLNEKHLLSFIYWFYTKHFLFGGPQNTQRICVVVKKK